jgi:Ser/Thr protein kinase RdoA (MazF antagonist)
MDRRSEKIFEAHREDILAEAARRYGINSTRLKRLGSFESVVYEYEQGGKSHILKLTHSIHRTPELVRGELDWTGYLIRNGMAVSRTVPSANGELLEIIDGRAVEALKDDYFLAYALEKAPGKLTGRSDWDDNLAQKWGRMVGRMHALAKTYTPSEPSWKRFEWHEDDSLKVENHVPASQPIIVKKCHELMDRMRSWPIDNESYGLIHSDMHHSNFVVNVGEITVFDFDDCHYSWFGFDIMIPLFYVMRDHRVNPGDIEFARWFFQNLLDGYSKENTIGKEWIRRIPDFLKLREIDLYSVIYAENAADENEWCRRFFENRQYRIENDIPVIDMDFSEFI